MENAARTAMDAALVRFAEEWLRSRNLPTTGEIPADQAARFAEEALAAFVAPGTPPSDAFDGGNSLHLGGTALAFLSDGGEGRVLYIASFRRPSAPGRLLDSFLGFAERAGGTLPLAGRIGPRDTVVWTVLSRDPLSSEDRADLLRVRDEGSGRYPSFEAVEVSLRDLMRREYGRPPFVWASLRFRELPDPERAGTVWLGMVSLADLYRFLSDYEEEAGDIDLLYSENIRLEQGSSRINRGIRETLKANPERFGLCNGGVTIIADEASIEDGDSLRLRGASIINGCQTTRSVLRVFRDGKEPVFTEQGTVADGKREWYERASREGFVMVKVVVAEGDGEDELVYRITKYANSQNAIGANEMLGQNEFLTELRDAFRCIPEHPVFLETKQGGWVAEQQTQALLPDRFRISYEGEMTAKELLKSAAAVHFRKPGLAAAGISRFVPGEGRGRYSTGMAELSTRDYYAAYLVLTALDGLGISFSGRHAGAWAQTRWLSCFLLSDALRHLDAVGRDPGSEPRLTETLIAVLSSPVATLVAGLVAGELGRLYEGYLLQSGSGSTFFSDSGSSDRGGFIKALDGDRLPEGLSRHWSAILGRLAAPDSEALRLVREVRDAG